MRSYVSSFGKNTKIQFYTAEKVGTVRLEQTYNFHNARVLTRVKINLTLELSFPARAIRASHLPTPKNNCKSSKILTAASILGLACSDANLLSWKLVESAYFWTTELFVYSELIRGLVVRPDKFLCYMFCSLFLTLITIVVYSILRN